MAGESEPPPHTPIDLPPMEAFVAPCATTSLVALPKVAAMGEAADLILVVADAPHALGEPCQVLERFTNVGRLPIQNGAQTVLVHDDVAIASVAVDRSGRDRRWVMVR